MNFGPCGGPECYAKAQRWISPAGSRGLVSRSVWCNPVADIFRIMHTFSAVGLSAVFTESVTRTKSVIQVGTSHVPAPQRVVQNLSSVSHSVSVIPAADFFMVTK